MNPHIKEEWVAALRGGKFQQIDGALREDGNKRCALGVMVDLYIKYHPRRAGWQIQEDGKYKLVTFNGLDAWEQHEDGGQLPNVVTAWAGLDSNNPEVETDDGDYEEVASLNDSGYSFDEIAGKIEFTSL